MAIRSCVETSSNELHLAHLDLEKQSVGSHVCPGLLKGTAHGGLEPDPTKCMEQNPALTSTSLPDNTAGNACACIAVGFS